MHQTEKINQPEFKTMPITEQLIFLVDTETYMDKTTKFKDRKASAILGALLADLFLMNKVRLVRNKVVVTSGESSIKYIDEFLKKIKSLNEQKRIDDLLYEVKPVAETIEEDVKKRLLAEEWLREKKGFNHITSQKKINIDNSDYLKALKAIITNVLAKKQEPRKEMIYVIALLDAIKLLKNFIEEGKFGIPERTRLNELLEKESLAKIIHNAIRVQEGIKLVRLKNIGSAGYLGIVDNQSVK